MTVQSSFSRQIRKSLPVARVLPDPEPPPLPMPRLIDAPPLVSSEAPAAVHSQPAIQGLIWVGVAGFGGLAAALAVTIALVLWSASSVRPREVADSPIVEEKPASPQARFVACIGTSGSVPVDQFAVSRSAESTSKPEPTLPPESFEDTVARVKASVVRIETDGGLGTGVVIDESGIVATNYHVISGAGRAVALFADGRKLPVTGFVYLSQECDLCLLQVKLDKAPVVALPIATELPKQGAAVFTVGNPEGLQFTVTKGIVSAVTTTEELNKLSSRRSLVLAKPGNARWIQTDASIDNGNSGGPLLSEQGTILGLNTFMLPSVNNAYFANTGPAIQVGLTQREPLTSLTSLPGQDRSRQAEFRMPAPEDMARATKGIERGDFGPALEVLIAYREQALLDAKINDSPQARDLQTNLMDVETGRVGLTEIMQKQKLREVGGEDFVRYLHVVQQLDEALERNGQMERNVAALAAAFAQPTSDLAGITAACLLHRIHLRDSSRTKVRELLLYLSQRDSVAARQMLDWYLGQLSLPASPNQKKFLTDLKKERELLLGLLERHVKQSEVENRARLNAREYNKFLTTFLFEQGFDHWKFRCMPTEQGLELSFGAGVALIVLPNVYGIKEPCDVLLSGRLRTRDLSVVTVDGVQHRFDVAAQDLLKVELRQIILESKSGDKALAVLLSQK